MQFFKHNTFKCAASRGYELSPIVLLTLALLLWPTSAAACWTITGKVTISGEVTTECVYVDTNGTVEILAGGALILTGNNNQDTSTILGSITLMGDEAAIQITSHNHTLAGTGTITGQSSTALIEIADGLTVVSTTNILGRLRIARAEGASDTTFINNGTITADGTGTLEIYSHYLDDQDNVAEESGSWTVGSSGNELWMRVGSDELTGDFTVSGGTLDVDASIITTGDLSFTAGVIEVFQGTTFQAGQ